MPLPVVSKCLCIRDRHGSSRPNTAQATPRVFEGERPDVARAEEISEMIDHVARIVLGAVDEGRLAAPEHRQSDRIEPGRVDARPRRGAGDPCDRRPERRASCSRGETRSPRRSTGSRRCRGRARAVTTSGTRVGSKRSGGADVGITRVRPRPLVERVEQPVHLEVGQRELIAQPAGKQRPAVAHRRQPADELDADRGERVEVERRPLRACRPAAATAACARASGRRSRRSAGSRRPTPPSTTARRGRDRSAAAARARRPTASRAGPSGGSRRPAGRRSPRRRRPARRRPAAARDCGTRAA